MRIVDLLDLATAGASDPEETIRKAFEWEQGRLSLLASWLLGIAASVSGAWIAILYTEPSKHPSIWAWTIVVVGVVGAASLGLRYLKLASSIGVPMMASICLYHSLRGVAEFIHRYRDAVRQGGADQ